MKQPTTLRILGRDYAITCDVDGARFGYCDNTTAIVNVRPGGDGFTRVDTLVHEIMHAVLFQQGHDREAKLEESFVRPLATGLTTVLRDNPALLKYIQKGLV